MQEAIETEGFDAAPELREDLLRFIEQFSRTMTLEQAGSWFQEAFP
jgi:hypothetical protein